MDVASRRPFYNRNNTLKIQSSIKNIQSLESFKRIGTHFLN